MHDVSNTTSAFTGNSGPAPAGNNSAAPADSGTAPTGNNPAAPAADAVVPEVDKTVEKITRVEFAVINTRTGATEKHYHGPNHLNLFMWLHHWRTAHEHDHADYVISANPLPSGDTSATPMTVDALLDIYSSSIRSFNYIKQRLGDLMRELMIESTLASAMVTLTFLHPQKGPTAVAMLSENTMMDYPETVQRCTDISISAAKNAIAQYDKARKQAKKHEIVMPDRGIIIP